MSKIILFLVSVFALVGVGWWFTWDQTRDRSMALAEQTARGAEVVADLATEVNSAVKDFTITSFSDGKDAWFSLNEIHVKQGDFVRIKITNLKGSDNFNLEALGVSFDTPLNQEMVTSFVAYKPGVYEYYVRNGKDGRAQTGKLIVE